MMDDRVARPTGTRQRCWLRCANCGVREWINRLTGFGPCPSCGKGPRFAEGDDGEPMVVWSTGQDPAIWGTRKP